MVDVDNGTKPLSSPPMSPPVTRTSPACGPAVGVEVAVAVGLPLEVELEVGVAVAVTVGVPDPVKVGVAVGEPEVDEVGVAVGEPEVDEVGVAVGVCEVDEVGVEVGVPDVDEVGVAVGVCEVDEVGVEVGVPDPVMVGVDDGDSVGVIVGVGVPLIPVPDNANLRFPPLLLIVRPLLRKILPAEVGWNTIIMSQRLAPGRDPSQVSLTSLKGGLTVMLLILMVFFLFVLMTATDNGALVVPTMTGPKSAPRMTLELLLRNSLEPLVRNCKSPSDCANAGRASAPSRNNSAKVEVASDRVIDLIPMIKNPPSGRSYIVAYFAKGSASTHFVK